jgi:hypothetical protein
VMPVLFLMVVAGLVWLLYKQGTPPEMKRYFWLALFLKLAASLLFIALYVYYFKVGDVLSYNRQAIRLNQIAFSDWDLYTNLFSRYDILPREPLPVGLKHWGNPSSWLLVKILSLIYLLNQNNIWLAALAFGLFSFWGMWRLAVALIRIQPDWRKPVLISFFLIPSVALWTSGIGKEMFFWAGIGLFLSSAIRLYNRSSKYKLLDILVGLLGLWLSWEMRYFIVAILLGCLLAWILCNWLAGRVEWARKFWVQMVLFFGLLLSGIVLAPLLHPNFKSRQLIRLVVKSNQDLQQDASPEDRISYDLAPTFTSLIENSPKALVAALVRPYPWEVDNKVKGLAAVENILLLGLLIFAFLPGKQKEEDQTRFFKISLWVFVLISALFLSLATPVFGSLHRYRVCFLPVYAFLLLSTPRVSRFQNRESLTDA